MGLYREKFFKLWPWERDLITRTPFESLIPVVRELNFERSTPAKRAIRCRLPKDLKTELSVASKRLAKPMVEILVRAARIYREENPPQPDWQPPDDQELFEYEDKKLVQMVVYLSKDDRRLIQDLGRGVPTVLRRRDAFQALIPIVQQLIRDSGFDKDPTRVSVRVKIPLELDAAIVTHTAKGDKYVQVLLEACRHAEAARQEQS